MARMAPKYVTADALCPVQHPKRDYQGLRNVLLMREDS